MRVLILTFSTQGDVLPHVALASGLLARGHEAAVCTAEGFRDLVTETGVPYEYMSDAGDGWTCRSDATGPADGGCDAGVLGGPVGGGAALPPRCAGLPP